MLKRTLVVTVIALATMVGPAAAQESPGGYGAPPGPPFTPPGPPPSAPPFAPPGPPPTVSGPLVPGAVVSMTVSHGNIAQGRDYGGTLRSTPVSLPTTTAASDGAVTFANVQIPSDWDTNANHSLSVVDAATGALVYQSTFFVTANGMVAGAGQGAEPGQGGDHARSAAPLARTGDDSSVPLAQTGLALVAAGGLTVYLVRRRQLAKTAIAA